MKILYLNPDPGIPILGDKGASVHVREFVTAVSQQGHEVALVCASLGEGNAPPPATLVNVPLGSNDACLEQECVAQGLPLSSLEDRVLRRELGWLCHDRGFFARTRAALDDIEFRPDVIYERYSLFHFAGVALARALSVPRLLEVNAPLIHEQEQFRGLVLKFNAELTEKLSYENADSIIAVSDEVAAYVVSRGVRRENVLTIPNGVDISRFCLDHGGEGIRRKFDLGADPVVGFIGSFKPWHGVGFLIKAFAVMARRHSGVRLLCVGDGPELEMVRAEIGKLGLQGRVIVTGRVPHAAIPLHLAAMDMSAAPYLPSQGFYFSPLKVVESLAAGVPVIAARIGQLEHLVDDGRTGVLFTPGDEADFIAKTLELVRDPTRREAMSMAARQRATLDFSWQQATQRIIGEAKRLIALRCAA
ncbi:MAG: glycosyltransferase family 4 protein [Alphaproteobacteria bacterium]|nr:glycosyltransferase family 4 protein [Alphaproteobacteria bacterium]MDE2494603.1 glycosyltransferase family 4 protein [Alphaproteobacteria bacterium]